MDLSKINYVPVLLGVYPNEIRWSCRIGDQSFEYRTGLGYLKTRKQLKDVPVSQKNMLQLNRDHVIDSGIHKALNLKNNNDIDILITRGIGVEHPKLEHVLHCLFLDSEAHNESFKDWCSNFGYDDDSIKAKSIYEACIENYHKLKKALKSDYNLTEEYIRSLEL